MNRIISAVIVLIGLAAPASADTKACEDAYEHRTYTIDELIDELLHPSPIRDPYEAALKECRPLAEQGYAKAQFILGFMYENGQGVPQDYAETVKWYRKAAEQGHASAQNNLGFMYDNGRGVTQDYVQAHMWFNLAAAGSLPDEDRDRRAKNRDIVAKLMTPAQVAEAQRLARAWRPKQHAATSTPPAPDPALVRERFARIQRQLASLGYDTGPADGVLGPRTRAAIRAFEAREGLPVTGTISERLEAALRSASVNPFDQFDTPAPRSIEIASTGSGFYVSNQGHVLTNEHVVNGCAEVRIPPSLLVEIVAQDEANDLALLKSTPTKANAAAKFRGGRGIRPGDDIVVLGYPLRGILASEANVTTGTVSALAGPGDDRRFIQITAPVQPGNSGGPVLDGSGHVVGVVVARLDALKLVRRTGRLPQNVNFAISEGAARAFLDAYDVPYETADSKSPIPTADIAAKAKSYTVLIECWK